MFKTLKIHFVLLLALFLGIFNSTTHAAEQKGDGKDHPLLSRMPGYVVYAKKARDFDAVSLREGEIQGKIPSANFPLMYEGKLTVLEYTDEKEATSSFAVYRNYAMAVRSLGGQQLNTGFEQSSYGVQNGHHVFEIPNKGEPPTVVLLEIDGSRKYSLTIIEPKAMVQDVKVNKPRAPN